MKLADLTVNERILLHLRDYSSEFSGVTAPFEQTQEGISEGVDVRINHVPRAVKKIRDDGLIEEYPAHVQGLKRKRKVYLLTNSGRTIADDIVNRLLDEEVVFRSEEGSEQKMRIRDVPLSINTPISVSKLILHAHSHGLILELKLKRKMDEQVTEFVSNLQDVPAHFYGRDEEIEKITDFSDGKSKLMLVTGIKGVGKTSLVKRALFSLEGQFNIFWFTAHEWDTAKSFFVEMSEQFVRSGKKSLLKYLKSSREIDLTSAFAAFQEDLQGIESVVVFDNAFHLQKELEHALSIVCTNVNKLDNLRVIITTREDDLTKACGMSIKDSDVLLLKIEGLKEEAAFEMMKYFGVEKKEQKRIYGLTSGHPLVLELVNSDKLTSDMKELTKEEQLVVKCLKAFDAIFE